MQFYFLVTDLFSLINTIKVELKLKCFSITNCVFTNFSYLFKINEKCFEYTHYLQFAFNFYFV